MKKIITVITAAVMIVSMMGLASCGKSEFGLTENTEKAMTIEAKNAKADDYFMSGSLEVDEGEQINVSADLSKGSVRVELIKEDEEQSIDKLPDMDGEPLMKGDLQGTDGMSGTVEPGSYMLRATVLEKATGTVQINAGPAIVSEVHALIAEADL